MSACSSALLTRDLDRLLDQHGPGAISLTVPLVADVVQVGIGGDFPTTTLVVSVAASAVRVRRADGSRLQVHIVENWCDATAPGVATPVFDAPVRDLVLQRCAGSWALGSGRRARAAALDRFVGTLVRFALARPRGAGGVDQAVGAA